MFWYILNALSSASPCQTPPASWLPPTQRMCHQKAKPSSMGQVLPPASRLPTQQRKPPPAFPPAKRCRDPGRWRPCNPSSQTAACGRTPTELLSPKPRSWPWCQNRLSSTCGGRSWPPGFCAGRWLDSLCEEKRSHDGGKRAAVGLSRALQGQQASKGRVSPQGLPDLTAWWGTLTWGAAAPHQRARV